MKPSSSLRSMGTILVLLLTLGVALTGCGGGAEAPRLRITNTGDQPIQDLIVLFPEREIAFGDVGPGETTDYEPVSGGVYRYAAYRFQVDGQEVTQPVIDWVGEEPVPGQAFTYVLDYDPAREPIQQIILVNVVQEE